MNQWPKVSIITTCFNGARFINRYVNVILSQTYQSIEVIFIDDGSTDETEIAIKSHNVKFKQKNIELKYFYQKNQGLGGATNNGLKHMTGDYFMIYDVDDILVDDCLEKRVLYLENHLDFGFVRSKAWVAFEPDLMNKKPDLAFEKNKKSGWIYDEIIENKIGVGTFYYLYKTAAFIKVNPEKKIYNTRACQDVQLVHLMAYYFQCGFIDEYHGMYVRNDHSHSMQSYLKKLNLTDGYQEAAIETLKNIDTDSIDKEKFIGKINLVYNKYKEELLLVYLSELLNKNSIVEKKYIIFGSGVWGRNILKIIGTNNIRHWVDNSIKLQQKNINGILIEKPEDILYGKNCIVVIAVKNHGKEIEKQLKQMGLSAKQIIYYKDFIYGTVSQYLDKWKNG